MSNTSKTQTIAADILLAIAPLNMCSSGKDYNGKRNPTALLLWAYPGRGGEFGR
jgi:hypothetical protein